MDYLEIAGRESAFSCLGFHLQQKTDIPEYHKFRIEKTENVLGEVIRGLESMTSGLGYYFVEDLREIVEAMGHASPGYPIEKIKEITAEFKKTLTDLMRLEESPREVYEDEERRKRLLDSCKRMSSFYSKKIPNHPVFYS